MVEKFDIPNWAYKLYKEPSNKVFYVDAKFCKIFKNTFFTEHLWTTAFELAKAPNWYPS